MSPDKDMKTSAYNPTSRRLPESTTGDSGAEATARTRTRTTTGPDAGAEESRRENPGRTTEPGSEARESRMEAVPRTGTEGRNRIRGDGARAERRDGRSIAELLRELSNEGAALVSQEVALAKAEMQEKVNTYQRNVTSIGIGSALMLGGVLLAVWLANLGLTALLAQFMDPATAVWLAPLILAIGLLAVGWGMIAKGRRAIGREGLTPRRTVETLEEDARWAKRKTRETREGIRHG